MRPWVMLLMLLVLGAEHAEAVPIFFPFPAALHLPVLSRHSRAPQVSADKKYDSYSDFNPDQYERDSPEWNLAMIRYLLDMKKHGHPVSELAASEHPFSRHSIEVGPEQVVCKMEPFNVCYKIKKDGSMEALGNRRPVRLMRVLK